MFRSYHIEICWNIIDNVGAIHLAKKIQKWNSTIAISLSLVAKCYDEYSVRTKQDMILKF